MTPPSPAAHPTASRASTRAAVPTFPRARRALALALVAAVVAVAGCGSASTTSPAPSAAAANPSVAPSAAPGSATPAPGSATPAPGTASAAPGSTPLPAGSFTFDLPAGWRAVPVSGSHDSLIAALRAENAAFADSLAARLDNLSSTTSYVAFDASPSTVRKGDVVMLIVTEVALPVDVSLETFSTTIKDQVSQLVEKDVELRRILVTAGQAYSLAYSAPLTRPDGQPGTVAVTQVLYVLPGRGYVLTFAAPPGSVNDYAQTIADIATSFTIRT
jgi:hypothetical protein